MRGARRPVRAAAIARKIEQLRDARRTGLLDSGRDPVDVLAPLHRMATTWAGRPGIRAGARQGAGGVPPSASGGSRSLARRSIRTGR
ncbi:hypothetical protein AB0O42_16610 [Streptomyces sp. NPDC089922]|uniref:hypothetical protein n=1 Tax=Streptomyces sp. NPDC089922 TaxID=3155189 RepID=UPI0034167F3E